MTFTVMHVKARRTLPNKKADSECEKSIKEFTRLAKEKIKEWKNRSRHE